MYGNIESSQAEQGQMWVLGPGDREVCSDLCPTEENLYEPLDPAITVPSQKHVSDSPSMAWARAEPSPAGPNHAAVKASAPQFCPSRGSVVTHPPFPASGCRSRDKLVLVGAVALGVSMLVNVVLLTVGSRHVAALTEALEAEKAKELPNMVSQSFLLYNEDHRMCVEARGRDLAVTTCQPEAMAQRFQWLQGGRLWGWGGQHCITATSGQNLALVRLEPCRDDSGLQRWECREGGLLALAGYNLYFNYGNNKQRTVMLYTGDREWSRWVIHGSKDNICSRSSCSPCPKGWTYWGNSCYFYSKTPSSWDNAQRFCSALGTQLLEVDGTEEKGHIQSMLQGSSWLGISDAEVEGTWKRGNGTILLRQSSSWHRDEPNGGRQENCAAVREDGQWYDYPCTYKLPWVCEGRP